MAFQIILTLICTIVSNIWESKYGQYHWYLSLDESNFSRIVGRYINFYLLFNGIVPVSLYVTVEFVRVGQALFLYWDSKMYDPETKSGLTPRTSNLNEELAQVFLFFLFI